MLNVTDLKKGTYFTENGVPFEVLKYEHIKMGRGTANIKLKVRNLLNGAIVQKGYISGKRVEEAEIKERKVKYLYRTGREYVFQDEESGEEVEIEEKKVREKGKFLKKNLALKTLFYEKKPLSLKLPIKVVYQVKEAPPDARGDSVAGSYKEVLLENNLRVKTPMFIKEGETILVDTRTGEYVSRKN